MSSADPASGSYTATASPIFSLRHNIVHAFENARGGNRSALGEAVASGLVAPTLEVLVNTHPACGPRLLLDDVPKIQFHVAHLELVWAFAYSWLVIFEEAVQKPLLEQTFYGRIWFHTDLTQRAAQLLGWARSLRMAATPWPDGLPTPTHGASVEEQCYVDKANSIFQDAMAFMAYHEFAHARYRHHEAVDPRDRSAEGLATAVQLECEADDVAFHTVVPSGATDSLRRMLGWSVLTPVLSSLYLLRGPRALRQTRHPHMHHRIQAMLEKLAFDEASRDYFTYLCVAVVQDFAQTHHGAPTEPRSFDTADDAFSAWLDECDDAE
jgi:hypothetical protein